jgi:hypothetical protein
MPVRRTRAFLIAAIAVVIATIAASTTSLAISAPTVFTTPTTVTPGQAIKVNVSGFTAPAAGTIQCVGLLGPGQNVELNLTPAFRPNLGMITVATSGEGQTSVTLPTNLVGGSYRIVVGGCSPNGIIAPLAPVAAAVITVPGPTPPTLPASGGVPDVVVLLVGLALIAAGVVVRLLSSRRAV